MRLFLNFSCLLSAVLAQTTPPPPGFLQQGVVPDSATGRDLTGISIAPRQGSDPDPAITQILVTDNGVGKLYLVTVTEDLTTDHGIESVDVQEIADFSDKICTEGG